MRFTAPYTGIYVFTSASRGTCDVRDAYMGFLKETGRGFINMCIKLTCIILLSCLFLSACQKPSSLTSLPSDSPSPTPSTPIPTSKINDLPTATPQQKETIRPSDALDILFGILPEELPVKIDELGYEIEIPDYSSFENIWPEDFIKDGRIYSQEWGDDGPEGWSYSYTINSDDSDSSIFIKYNIDGELETLSMGFKGPTTEGLAIGDSFEKMIDIYGEDYRKLIVPLGDVYRYFNGNEYLFISFMIILMTSREILLVHLASLNNLSSETCGKFTIR